MENQYGQALNTHARFNAYASSPSIETSERIHNRHQAKLNYLCLHTHKRAFAHTHGSVACTAFILQNYIHQINIHTYIHAVHCRLANDISASKREQLRGKQKQKSRVKSRWSIKQQHIQRECFKWQCMCACVCVCLFVCVCVRVWACLLYVLVSRQRSSSSICTPASPATASERPFLVVVIVVAFDLSCASLGFERVSCRCSCCLLEEMRLFIRNQFLSKAELTRYTRVRLPITHISPGDQLIKLASQHIHTRIH